MFGIWCWSHCFEYSHNWVEGNFSTRDLQSGHPGCKEKFQSLKPRTVRQTPWQVHFKYWPKPVSIQMVSMKIAENPLKFFHRLWMSKNPCVEVHTHWNFPHYHWLGWTLQIILVLINSFMLQITISRDHVQAQVQRLSSTPWLRIRSI